MMNAVERVRKDYERRLREAEQEDALKGAIPDADRIFVLGKSLYEAVAWVTFGSTDYGKRACTWEEAVGICERYKPIAAKLVESGSLSIQPKSCKESERARSVIDIAPVWFEVETHSETTIELHWYTDTPKGVVRVGVKLGPLYPFKKIAKHDIEWVDYPGHSVVHKQRLTLGDELHAIWDESGRPVAQVERAIKWASGGQQYPSRFTVYFLHLDDDPNDAEVGVAMVKHMANLCRKEA